MNNTQKLLRKVAGLNSGTRFQGATAGATGLGLLGALIGLVHGATAPANPVRNAIRRALYGGITGAVLGGAGGYSLGASVGDDVNVMDALKHDVGVKPASAGTRAASSFMDFVDELNSRTKKYTK